MIYQFALALLLLASCEGQRRLVAKSEPAPAPAPAPAPVPEPIPVPSPPVIGGEVDPPRDAVCTSRNGYYKIDSNCDSYVECKEYRSFNKLCPEGLNYNPNAIWPAYPCSYPTEVPCRGRASQPAKPTADCPHQYGFYPSADTSPQRCGLYKMCVEGQAIAMTCPTGLAFNPDLGQCDWPELVPTCNVDEFLGFRCPAPPVDLDGKLLDVVQNFKYLDSCYQFFSCERGRARLLSCDVGFGFDADKGHCVDADLVQCNRHYVSQII